MTAASHDDPRELYRRMRLIPSWDYDRCAALDVTLVGAGGLGSVALQLLALLGIGELGTLTLVDDDRIEASNRSRIPYARPEDDGAFKVDVAARYLKAVRPSRTVRGLACSLFEREAQVAIAASGLLIGAVDSELGRVAMNHLAYAFCLPYVDGGAGIIVGDSASGRWVQSGGQVRLVVPDVTPCLLCNLGVEGAAVDRELVRQRVLDDPAEAELLRKSGYIRGLAGGAEQPSAAHLNFFVASAIVTLVIQYLCDGLPDYHALHLDLEAMEWLKSTAKPRPHCAVCVTGEIGHGRLLAVDGFSVPMSLQPEPAPGA